MPQDGTLKVKVGDTTYIDAGGGDGGGGGGGGGYESLFLPGVNGEEIVLTDLAVLVGDSRFIVPQTVYHNGVVCTPNAEGEYEFTSSLKMGRYTEETPYHGTLTYWAFFGSPFPLNFGESVYLYSMGLDLSGQGVGSYAVVQIRLYGDLEPGTVSLGDPLSYPSQPSTPLGMPLSGRYNPTWGVGGVTAMWVQCNQMLISGPLGSGNPIPGSLKIWAGDNVLGLPDNPVPEPSGSSGGITGLPNQTCQSLVPTFGEYDIFLDNAVSGFRNVGPGDYGWDVAVCVTLAQPIAQDTAYIILEVQDSHQDEIEVTGGPWQTGDTLCGVLHVADADASAWDWVSVRTPTFAYANMYSGTLCWGQTPNEPVPAVEASQTWKRAGLTNPGGGTLNVLEIPASVDIGGGGGGSYWVEPGELGAATSAPIGGDGLNLTPGMLPPWLVQLYGGATTGTVTGDTDYWPFYAEDTDHVAVTSGQWFEVEQQDDYEVPANTTWTALTLWLDGNVTQVTVDGYQGGSVTDSVTVPVTATGGITRVDVPWPNRLIDPTWGETAVITFRVTPAGTGLIRCHAASLAYGFPYGSAFYSDPVQDPASTYSPGGLSPTSWAAQAAYTNSPMPGAANAQYVLDDPPTVSSAYAALTGGMSSFYRCETLQIPGDDVQKDISTYAQRTRWFDIHSYPTVDDFDLDFFAHPGIIGHYFPVNGEYAWYDGDYAESPGLQGVDGVNHFQVPVGSTLELNGQVTVFDQLNTAEYGGDPPEWLLRVVTSSVTGPQTANFRITYDGGFTSPPISQGDADTLYAPNWEGYANVSSQVFSHGAATPITPVSVGTGYAQQGRYVGVQLALNGGDYRNNLMVTTRSSYPATSTATATAFGVTRTFTPPVYRYIFAASGWDDTSPTPDPGGPQPQPGRWHTCDNHEPPPAGGQWGDGGVEPNWAHVSWMRLKDQPGSGRTGRMKIKMTDGTGGGTESWSSPAGSPSTVPDIPDNDEPTGGFAAITYNMPGWVPNRRSELNDLLDRCSIIGLQEVNWFDDNNWDAQLPGWSFVQRDGKGQAVGWDTSKWVLQEWGWWKIADATSVQPAAAGPTNRPSSGVTWAVLRRQSTGGLLRFGTVHLTPSKHLGGAVLALYQTEVAGIADWWDSTSAYPTLLVGDFNGQPQDGPLGPLRNRAQVQAVTSFGSRSIDLLWSSSDLTRTGVRAIGGHNSDHKPVRGTYTS